MLAALGGVNLEVIKFLVERGANVKAENRFSSTPYDYATENDHENIAKYLKGLTQSDSDSD